jgi:hypothetical protein
MIREEDVLAALEKPKKLYPIQKLVDPEDRSGEALQALLVKMRAEGKVKFDIHSGKWAKTP